MMELKKIFRTLISAAFLLYPAAIFAGDVETTATSGTNAPAIQQTTTPNSHDLFSLQTMYTGSSKISGGALVGRQDSTYSDVSYAHRFDITGNWYLRLGLEYERYDFTGAVAPLPDHLQDLHANIAYEYVVQDFPAVGVELHPGVYFENNITSRNFDVPVDIFTSFKLLHDKVFGVVGVNYGGLIYPPVSGFGGIIWLINDKTRLQAVFPRPALIYDMNDDWELQLNAQINGGGFRLDESGRAPATYSGAAVRYTYDQVGVQATYKKWKPFDVVFGAGYNLQREFDFIHYGPDQKYRSSGAPYVSITFNANF